MFVIDPVHASFLGMSLRRYDLNLLTVLDALLRHRNVTRAGKELGLSQSAASHALMRLRELFGDALLVPSGREMICTQRAEAIVEPLEGLLAQIERLLATDSFDPASAVRRFRLGTADYVALMVLPEVMRKIQDAAPRVTIHVTWAVKDVPAKLRSNLLDLAIVPRGLLRDDDLHAMPLFTDDLVVAACIDHPEIGETLDRETFERQPHASFRRENTAEKSFAETQLFQNRIQPQQSVMVSDFLLLPFILPGTRCITLIHRRLGERLRAAAPIKLLPPPFPTDRLFIEAYWSHEAHSDPAHRWFRTVLAEA